MVSAALRYVVASGVPALINFASLTIYTRLLTPFEYGRYALVMACVASANAIGFQWIRSGARRYLPDSARRVHVLRSLPVVYSGLFGAAGVVALLVAMASPHLALVAGLALLLLGSQAWFELNQEIAIAGLRPLTFGLAALAKAVLALGVTLILVRAGWGGNGVVIGLAVGFAVPALALSRWVVTHVERRVDRATLGLLAAYGLPLTASYALQFVLDSSDRLLLGAFGGPEPVGAYAASYDLASQTITLLFMMINLAAFPMALRALREEGDAAARERLAEQAMLLAAIGMPAAVAIAVLSPLIGSVLLGARFAVSAASLLPIIAVGVFAGAAKAFYFDLAFQIGERTTGIIKVGLIAAMINVLLNLVAIPRWGVTGAATTTAIAFAVGCILSAFWGRRAFAMPLPWQAWRRIAASSAAMAAVIWPFRADRGVGALAAAVAAGGLIYLSGLMAMNVGGYRHALASRWAKGR